MVCKSFYVLSILRIVFSIFFVQLWNRIETNDSAWNKSSFLYLLFFYFIYKNNSETVSLSKKEKRKKKCIAQETFSYYKQVISFQLPYYYSNRLNLYFG